MENREILIASTKTQKRYKINTSASTLGELKAELAANQNVYVHQNGQWVQSREAIDYSGMSFTEGLSNSLLLDDTSSIPATVTYKGEQKNPVILLTNTSKKISSGGSRADLYATIKAHGLQEEIKNVFGKNYTVVPSDDLQAFINDYWKAVKKEENEEYNYYCPENHTEEEEEGNNCFTPANVDNSPLVESLYDHIKALVKVKALTKDDVWDLGDLLDELKSRLIEGGDEDEKQYEEQYEEPAAGFEASDTTVSSDDIDALLARL